MITKKEQIRKHKLIPFMLMFCLIFNLLYGSGMQSYASENWSAFAVTLEPQNEFAIGKEVTFKVSITNTTVGDLKPAINNWYYRELDKSETYPGVKFGELSGDCIKKEGIDTYVEIAAGGTVEFSLTGTIPNTWNEKSEISIVLNATDAGCCGQGSYVNTMQEDETSAITIARGACGANATYTLDMNGKLTISGSGEVTGDGQVSTFAAYSEQIKKVVIEEGITAVGDYAFLWMQNLKEVVLPKSLISIGNFAFYSCYNITDITLPDGVTSIGEEAFAWCDKLGSIMIPESVDNIGERAFANCFLTTDIEVDEDNKHYMSENGVLFNKEQTELITVPAGKKGEYTVPEGVRSINDSAFSGCHNITGITLPEGIENIGAHAFYECFGITEINLPNGLKRIGDIAFGECNLLKNVKVPESVEEIGNGVFIYCSNLESIEVVGNNINYVTTDGVLFNKEKTVLICVPAKKIGVYEIPKTVTKIADSAFSSCRELINVVIPEGVQSIGKWTFDCNNSLINIVLPEGITSIGEYAFNGCSNLLSITIPDSVSSIGENAFASCHNLTIYGELDSYAQTYAKDNNIPFEIIDESGKKQTCLVIFEGNGGLVLNGVSKRIESGNTLNVVPVAIREGYIFEGWYTAATGGEVVTTDTVITEDVTFYARWIPDEADEHEHKYSEEWTVDKKASYNVNGSKSHYCTRSGCTGNADVTVIPSIRQVKLSKDEYIYTGKTVKPDVIITDTAGKELLNGTDYTIIYPDKSQNVGVYTVTIKFTGDYTGEHQLTYTVLPKGTSIRKLIATDKSICVRWKKQSKQTNGYEIQYSTNKKFKKKATNTVIVNKNKTTSKKLTKLKMEKKYYVRIRTYKTVKVNGKSKKLYSSWSKAWNEMTK